MSKGDGLKIGIKFTEDIVGDVSGNESAFIVEGKEYKHINGALIDGDYQVKKVERYPVQKVWELEKKLMLDSTQNKEYGLIEGEIVSAGSTTTYEMGWSFKVGNEDIIVTGLRINPETSGRRTIKLWDVSGELLRSVSVQCIPEQWVEGTINEIKLIANTNYVISADFIDGNYRTDNINEGATTSPKISYIDGRYTNVLNSIPDYIASRPVIYGVIDIVIKEQEIYSDEKIHTFDKINISGEYRIKWLSNIPKNTNAKIEVATIENDYNQVNNGDIITANGDIWIKVTLSTEDINKTPILKELWLEDASASQNKILITMDWWGRFNNVEGDLTVSYDAFKGNLSGRGGAVEDFEVSFAPSGLIQTLDPHEAELLEVNSRVEVELLEVTLNNRLDTNTIAAMLDVVIELIHVSEINP